MKIAIDGPAGSGKSSIAREVSIRFNIPYLETGLAYRAVGYVLSKEHPNIDSVSWEVVKPILSRLEIRPEVGGTEILLDGADIKESLKDENVGRYASMVGTVGEFREYINALFRELLKNQQGVIEGRDAGTNIFPDADLKLFITASPEERAKRRLKQLESMGVKANYEEVLRKIVERDDRDMNRKDYPFKPAQDAVIIDTTGKSIEKVLEEVLSLIERAER